ncbi:hypothetical protein BV25DRAFT_1419286 [Artomyces pyxidatus]|uniref:Uncharacterized protein n=1 Tax=Artomyces pyxidatus TaxID=48021 RepID=A0ACB8TE58_9AGAM|nr:hypothetical protein BV25DRAFT_1419286 [Artomyces pyxidatus]
MGNGLSLPAARGVTLFSFAVNFSAQVYGMLTKPNMKDVADANHYAFSPHPMSIAGFFSFQVIVQALWLRELFAMRPAIPDTAEAHLQHATLAYAPIYALGNLCITGWLWFWLREQFGASQAFVTANTTMQVLALALIPGLAGPPRSASRAEILLHLVAKTFAGVGVLDIIDNGAVWLKYSVPSTTVQVATGAGFVLGGMFTDTIFGTCLVYDLVGFAMAQEGQWGRNLGWLAGTTAAAVGLKAINILTSGQFGGGIRL